jgi:hypothetical protein
MRVDQLTRTISVATPVSPARLHLAFYPEATRAEIDGAPVSPDHIVVELARPVAMALTAPDGTKNVWHLRAASSNRP